MDQESSDSKTAEQPTMKNSKAYEHDEPELEAAPPPSYPETQNNLQAQSVPSSIPGNSAYPPLPHHTQAPSRTFHIEYESALTNRARILAEDNTTLLYILKLHLSKPYTTIDSVSTGSTIGTVTFHTLSNRIDTTIQNSPIALTPRGILKFGYKFTLRGEELSWKMQKHKLDLVCVDEAGVARARFCFANWSLRKCGVLEVFGSGEGVEELLVTGLAVVQYTLAAVT
jgi:hypothetical protein